MLRIIDVVTQFYDADCSILLSAQTTKDHPTLIEYSLDNLKLHDPDYAVFKHFRDPRSTVLDVGANWGYSVTSMLAAGCNCSIVSFEPLACYAPHLTRLKEKLPGRYDFFSCALGAEGAELRFVTPVLNGNVLTAYTSASEVAHRENLWRNLEWEVEQCKTEKIDIKFIVSRAGVRKLDDAVADIANISAIKIDTEGHESNVIAGGLATIERHRPMLMIEGANRSPGVVNPLAEAGYVFAERDEDRLRLSMRFSNEPNGFFIHRSRIVDYAQVGLLALD